MIKKLLKIVSILLLMALCTAGIFFYSIFISVERLTVDYNTITSTKIPNELHDVKVAFISDLLYNGAMDKERLTGMIQTINDVKPDVVIFGGDVFNLPLTYFPNDVTKQEVSQLLKDIEAPLGKFAVLGEQDNVDEKVREVVKDVLYTSDFELINNNSVRIRNGSNASITLIGLDSLVNGTIDLESAFSNVSADEYNILVAHCPDTVQLEGLPKANIDLIFAGHSHTAQIYIPLLGSLSSEEGAKYYNHGKHTINNLTLHVTNGMGTSTMDMRLFSPPQMLVYRLQHEEVVVPKQPTENNDQTNSEQPQTDESQGDVPPETTEQ